MNAKVILLLQPSATTNDTTIPGSDISTALESVYPSIQGADIEALIAVCESMIAESEGFDAKLSCYLGLSNISFCFLHSSSIPISYRRRRN